MVRELKHIGSVRGLLERIHIDNGPEMLAHLFTDWREENGIDLAYIQPGKPSQNAYIGRFNRSLRNELFDSYLFTTLDQVREMSAAWMISYNEGRSDDSLGPIPPTEFRRQITGGVSICKLSAWRGTLRLDSKTQLLIPTHSSFPRPVVC